MPGAADKVATFSVNLGGDVAAAAKDNASALEEMRAKIDGSIERVKQLSAASKSLRGASEEIVGAKKDLKAIIEAERGAISQANLALLKQGTTYEKLTADMRKAEAAQKKLEAKKQADLIKKLAEAEGKLNAGIKAAGGPLHDLIEKTNRWKEVMTGAGGSAGALGLAVGVLVVGVAAITTAIVVATLKLASFVVESADAMRTLGLMRESMTGSAASGKALGTWVDYLGHRVKLTREELTDLALANDRAFSPARTVVNPRKMGQVVQEITYAMAQAKAGMGKFGDEASGKLREIIERGKVFGRTRITPEDLEGTGIKFAEVADAYAKLNHISVDQARKSLQGYGSDVLAVAKALHAAADNRFAKTNAEQLLSLDVQWAKFKERLISLAGSGVLEPLLKGLSRLLYTLDPASASGKRLQATFEKLGTAIGNIDVGALSDRIGAFITKAAAAGEAVMGWWKTLESIASNRAVIITLEAIGVAIGVVVATVVAGVGLLAAGIAATGLLITGPFIAIYEGYKFLKAIGWKEVGSSIIDGLIDGIVPGGTRLWAIIKGLAGKVKDSFKSALGISSPSKVFAGYGIETAAGYAKGVEKGAPRAQGAVQAMAPGAPAATGDAASGPSSSGPLIVHQTFEIVVGPGQSGADVVRAIKESSLLGDVQHAIRLVLLSQGIPTQAVPT
jgi:hypothetical protein